MGCDELLQDEAEPLDFNPRALFIYMERKMQDIKNTIARNVVTIRKQQNLTQTELAVKTGVSTTYIGEIETRRKYPSIKTLVKISKALDIEPYILLIDPETHKNDIIIRYNEKVKDEFSTMLQKLEVFR